MRLFTGVCLVASLALAACGGGSDDRLLSELSDADFIAVCEDIDSGLSDSDIAGLVGFQCLLEEAFAQDGCMQSRLDTCIDAGITAWTGLECEAPAADDEIRMCEATVDEMVACLDAQYAQYGALAEATCADLETFEPTIPAACGPVQTKCPEFFDDGSA